MGYGRCASTFSGFSCEHGITSLRVRRLTASLLSINRPDFPKRSAYELALEQPMSSLATLLYPRITPHNRYRNINLLPIDYAFRPHLRDRLTLGGLPWPRKPWTFGGKVFHLPFTLLMLACALVGPPTHLAMHLHRLPQYSPTTLSSPQLRCYT